MMTVPVLLFEMLNSSKIKKKERSPQGHASGDWVLAQLDVGVGTERSQDSWDKTAPWGKSGHEREEAERAKREMCGGEGARAARGRGF